MIIDIENFTKYNHSKYIFFTYNYDLNIFTYLETKFKIFMIAYNKLFNSLRLVNN